jgi:hypothetical protein
VLALTVLENRIAPAQPIAGLAPFSACHLDWQI